MEVRCAGTSAVVIRCDAGVVVLVWIMDVWGYGLIVESGCALGVSCALSAQVVGGGLSVCLLLRVVGRPFFCAVGRVIAAARCNAVGYVNAAARIWFVYGSWVGFACAGVVRVVVCSFSCVACMLCGGRVAEQMCGIRWAGVLVTLLGGDGRFW